MVVIIIFVIFSFMKVEHQGRRIKIIVIILVALFIYLSVSQVFTSPSVDLKSPKGVISAFYFYVGWVGKSISNIWSIGAETTGKVIQAVRLNQTG